MVGFFPCPYPDELYYSLIARFHVRSGNISPKSTIEELFGSRSVTAVVDLPANINDLVRNLPIGSQYSSEDLIWNHTMYPFYSAFLPSERVSVIIESMKENGGGSIHNRTGIMASSIKDSQFLKYCPLCVEIDRERYGELYWHRSHQIPGVVICTVHNSLLCYSQVRIHNYNRHEFTPATLENCMESNIKEKDTFNAVPKQTLMPTNSCNDRELTALFDNNELSTKYRIFVDNVDKLLTHSYPNKPMGWFYQQYLKRLQEIGIANVNGRIRQGDLAGEFLKYYGEPFLEIVQSSFDPEDEDNWLQAIVRKHRKTFHPIRHLLMIQFLGLTLEELFEEKLEYKPFGNSPWPCLNPGANHYLMSVVKDLKIRYDNKEKSPIGTFKCSCGFTYTRKGPDTSEKDRYRKGRVKVFGAVWEERLKELLKKDLSLREIARRLKVDVKIIKKYMDIHKDDLNLTEGVVRCNKDDETIQRHREEWLYLTSHYPDCSITKFKELNQALYAWLYRNDKKWLNSNSPVNHKGNNSTQNRVDWERRDNEILGLVQTTVELLITSKAKPEQITISKIGKKIGRLSLLEKHLDKLPQTNNYLAQVIETRRDYHIRRIQWAIEELENEGADLKWWKVIKKAGIREETSEELKRILQSNGLKGIE